MLFCCRNFTTQTRLKTPKYRTLLTFYPFNFFTSFYEIRNSINSVNSVYGGYSIYAMYAIKTLRNLAIFFDLLRVIGLIRHCLLFWVYVLKDFVIHYLLRFLLL